MKTKFAPGRTAAPFPGPDLREGLRLTLVISGREAAPRSLPELADLAFQGGVTALQLREKNLPDREFYEEALALRRFCRERGRLFFINDRLDLALAVGADGLHLGQGDLPAAVAAPLFPGLLGVSVSTGDEARAALSAGAHYLGLGTIFPTGSKDDAQPISRENIRDIMALSTPTVAIGGLTTENAGEVWALGFTGLAVISALAASADPKEAARKLLEKSPR